MKDVKTVDSPLIHPSDPLIAKQKEDVASMRASLLCCSTDPTTAVQAMNNITVLRVYHQIARIIRYLEMMDKIEDKLYECIDYRLDNLTVTSPSAWDTLLTIQERLQASMIASHKLLQPYLNVKEFSLSSLVPTVSSAEPYSTASMIPKESRDKVRSKAQEVLTMLAPMVVKEEVNT